MDTIIGVLALQGGFASHIAILKKIGEQAIEVRTEKDLALCGRLIIPGGESTVLTKLLMESDSGPAVFKPWKPGPLFKAIGQFASANPVMGTCAGLIMLARPCNDERVVSLDMLPVTVERNAYGRQTESFVQEIEFEGKQCHATFIRAPRIISVEDGVTVLAWAPKASGQSDPVMVRYGQILGLTFHPELTPMETRIHEYFAAM